MSTEVDVDNDLWLQIAQEMAKFDLINSESMRDNPATENPHFELSLLDTDGNCNRYHARCPSAWSI